MPDQDFIVSRMDSLKRKYPFLRNEQDYHTFILLCIKYFYYSEPGVAFDPEFILQEYVTDGANDGGIDAVFNDPTSDANDVIIIQSKFYENTTLTADNVAAELIKIEDTIKDLENCKYEGYDSDMVTAYANARSQMSDEGEIKIVFFTSFKPHDKRSRNKIERTARAHFHNYEVEFSFRDDIEAQIELVDNGHNYVDYDQLRLDRANNFLEYEDNAAIVNISAKSLQELVIKRRNGLLGMNLRYYVRKKAVDSGIEQSIKRSPENFWYKNNGIVIVCEDYHIDGNILHLTNYSIVNGGQTTNRIGNVNIGTDFYLHCKVVKAKGDTQAKKDDFILSIAEATNAQKKIDTCDLKANTPEQLSLRERLARQDVYYVIKRGDKVPTRLYPEAYQSATMPIIGKLGLAGILQMPGSARSNPARMYQKEYYYSIYSTDVSEKLYADLLKLDYYYTQFIKTEIKDRGYDQTTTIPMFKNGKTFILACISLLCKINSGVFDYSEVSNYLRKPDDLKKLLRKNDGFTSIIQHKVSNEKELIYSVFSTIGDAVLGYCFSDALYRTEDLIPSNYLKLDTTYYTDVVKRLWHVYKQDTSFATAFNTIFKA